MENEQMTIELQYQVWFPVFSICGRFAKVFLLKTIQRKHETFRRDFLCELSKVTNLCSLFSSEIFLHGCQEITSKQRSHKTKLKLKFSCESKETEKLIAKNEKLQKENDKMHREMSTLWNDSVFFWNEHFERQYQALWETEWLKIRDYVNAWRMIPCTAPLATVGEAKRGCFKSRHKVQENEKKRGKWWFVHKFLPSLALFLWFAPWLKLKN